MAIQIISSIVGTVDVGQTVIFSISAGTSSYLYASFEWYLNDVLTSTENVLKLPFNAVGTYSVYVKVNEYCQVFWHDGHFYGGSFSGNFSGGTFHYGNLNGDHYTLQAPKPKKFIENIQSNTDDYRNKHDNHDRHDKHDIVYNRPPKSRLSEMLREKKR